MSNPFIPLTKTALKLEMSKNETRLFLVLTMQTLGYHKATDNLTDKRLSQLTGIRLDHLRPCLERFLNYGLFERIEHKHYDYQYRLCAEFLDDNSHLYPPTLPRHRENDAPCSVNLPHHGAENAPRSVDFPNDGGHTTENPYIKKPQQQTKTKKILSQKKQQQTKTEKTLFQEQPQPSVTISMAGLTSLPEKFIIESSQPIRLEFSAENVGQAERVATDTHAEISHQPIAAPMTESIVAPIAKPVTKAIADLIAEPVTESIAAPIAESVTESIAAPIAESVTESIAAPIAKPITESIAKPPLKNPLNANSKSLADLAASVATSLIQASDNVPSTTTEKQFVVVNNKEEKQPQPAKSKRVLKIPNVVGEEHTKACNRYFLPLNEQQKKDVLAVFFNRLKNKKVNSKVGYFIGLCQKASADGLTVPREARAKKPDTLEQRALNKKADEEREKRASLWADYQWIKRQSATLKKSELAMAEMMGL